jgi:hypothetical protein
MTVAIPAFTVIGYQGDYDFITLEDVVLNADEEITVYGAVGVFKSVSIEAPSSDLHVFRFNDDLISEDYKLYLNDEELPVTSISAEALEDNYLVQSNAVGGVNVTYLNLNDDFTHKYQTGDILRLDYIQYQNIPYSDENLLDLRAKFADTTGRDLSPAYMELSYAQSDKSLLTDQEQEAVLKELTYKRMFGIPMPYINKPRFMQIKINVNLNLNSSSIALAEYDGIVADILSEFEYRFSDDLDSWSFDLAEVERLLEKEANVRRASVYLDKEPFKKSEYYQLGDFFYDENTAPDFLYRVSNITYLTGPSEPDWDYTVGSHTNDGDVLWEAVPQSGYPSTWNATEDISLYDLRIPTAPEKTGIMFRAVQGKSRSHASTEPEWNTDLGSYTEDNELIWLAIEKVATASNWEPNTWYNLGDIIKAGSLSYQVVGERRRASNTAPDFTDAPEEIIYENMVLSREEISKEQVELPWGTYCLIVPTIYAEVQK